MKSFWKNVWKGFVVIIPFFVTFVVAFWLLGSVERFMGGVLKHVLPFYFPGLGILCSILVLFLTGRFMDIDRPGSKLIGFASRQMEKTPYVKTLYVGVRDLIRAISMFGERGQTAKQVVLVTVGNETRVLGLVTAEDIPSVNAACGDDTIVAVYVPMSYQMGGYTLFVPRHQLQRVDISVPQAMEMILSAAMVRGAQESVQ